MKHLLPALAWAALLIALPLLSHTGWISAARLAALTPTITVLAVVHLARRGGRAPCRVLRREARR